MNRHSRALVKAVDRVLDKMADHMRCPFCPADEMRGHNRGCPMMALLRAREEFGRLEALREAR